MSKELYDQALGSLMNHITNSDHVELSLALYEFQDILNLDILLNTQLESGYSILKTATINSDADTIECLMEWGAKFQVTDNLQEILHMAIYSNTESVVDFLLSKGMNATARDTTGNTPLHIAAMSGNKTMIKKLIIAGGDVDALNYAGITPREISLSTPLLAEKLLAACHETDMMKSQFDDTGTQLLPSTDHDLLGTARDQTYLGIDSMDILDH